MNECSSEWESQSVIEKQTGGMAFSPPDPSWGVFPHWGVGPVLATFMRVCQWMTPLLAHLCRHGDGFLAGHIWVAPNNATVFPKYMNFSVRFNCGWRLETARRSEERDQLCLPSELIPKILSYELESPSARISSIWWPEPLENQWLGLPAHCQKPQIRNKLLH